MEAYFKKIFTAIYVAAYKNHTDIVKLLYNSGASKSKALHHAARGASFDCIEFLLDIESNGNSSNSTDSLRQGLWEVCCKDRMIVLGY